METRSPVTGSDPALDASIAAESAQLDRMLECVRRLVEQGDVEAARSLATELERQWPQSEDVLYWARVLAPPKVQVLEGERGQPRDQERAWLREHAHEHPGCWLAVLGDQLVAADRDLGTVLEIIRRTPGAGCALLYLEPAE